MTCIRVQNRSRSDVTQKHCRGKGGTKPWEESTIHQKLVLFRKKTHKD